MRSTPAAIGHEHSPVNSAWIPWLLALAVGTQPALAFGSEAEVTAEEKEGTLPSRFQRVVDATHRVLSSSLEGTVLRIDRFFSREQYLRDSSDSFIRLRPEIGYNTDDDFEWDVNVAAKISLPGISDRISVQVWSDEDQMAGDDRYTDTLDSNSTGGLAFERDSKRPLNKWNIRPAIGVKGGWPLDPFLQGRATRYYNVEGTWVVRAQGTTRYLLDDGWDLRAELDFNRLLWELWAMRVRSDVRYREAKERINANQYFSFFQRLSEKRGMTYEFAIFASDDTEWGVRSYRLLVGYRQLVYKDWLYLEVMPELAFKDENDYDVTPGIRLRVEAFIGNRRLEKRRGRRADSTDQ